MLFFKYNIVLLSFSLFFLIASCTSIKNDIAVRSTEYISEDLFDGDTLIDGVPKGQGEDSWMIDTIGKEYVGWWIYGGGQHIFKDEHSLEEWDLFFLNENKEEIGELYLSITEMEYFPMECKMIGRKKFIDIAESPETRLFVEEFEILYIQGCGEIEEN